MKISPIPSPANTFGAVSGGEAQPSAVSKLRSLKMNTNATPGRIEEPPLEPAAADPALPISATNVDADSEVNEATQPLSPQFAALAKQRRSLQVKERELADREKALEAKAGNPADNVSIAKLKSNAIETLQELGIPYEQLTQEILANQDGFNPKIKALEDKIAALESGLDKKLTDRDAQAEESALAEMQKDAVLMSKGDDFELVRETGSIPNVMALIRRTYKETGEVLDVREAMQEFEGQLILEAKKLAGLKKVQSQLAPPAPAPQPMQYQQQRQMRTLTNRDGATAPMDRKQRALLAWQGNLKK